MAGYDIEKAVIAQGSRNTGYIIAQSANPVAIHLLPSSDGFKTNHYHHDAVGIGRYRAKEGDTDEE